MKKRSFQSEREIVRWKFFRTAKKKRYQTRENASSVFAVRTYRDPGNEIGYGKCLGTVKEKENQTFTCPDVPREGPRGGEASQFSFN